jgi:hypothetical protein
MTHQHEAEGAHVKRVSLLAAGLLLAMTSAVMAHHGTAGYDEDRVGQSSLPDSFRRHQRQGRSGTLERRGAAAEHARAAPVDKEVAASRRRGEDRISCVQKWRAFRDYTKGDVPGWPHTARLSRPAVAGRECRRWARRRGICFTTVSSKKLPARSRRYKKTSCRNVEERRAPLEVAI